MSPFWSQTRAPGTANDEATSYRTVPLPSLQEVCSTNIPPFRHIPLEVAAELAERFRHALQCAVDATENGEALLRFTEVLLHLAALLSALKLRSTGAAEAGHHTVVNTIKKRIVMWRIGRSIEIWNDATSLDAPRSFECETVELQKAYNIRRTIQLAQEGAARKTLIIFVV